MTEPVTLRAIELSAFRAYLEKTKIKLHRNNIPLSLVIFGANGMGKSSLVDALEFYFSKEGTLYRLGKNPSVGQTGRAAMRHVDASKNNAKTYVHLWFKQGSQEFDSTRHIDLPRTGNAETLQNLIKVRFIIRGYQLRRKLEWQAPRFQYQDFLEWFGLNSIDDFQYRLENLKRYVANKINNKTDVNRQLLHLRSVTNRVVSEWSEEKALDWLNSSILSSLDEPIKFNSLSIEDPAFRELTSKKQSRIKKPNNQHIISDIKRAVLIDSQNVQVKKYQKSDFIAESLAELARISQIPFDRQEQNLHRSEILQLENIGRLHDQSESNRWELLSEMIKIESEQLKHSPSKYNYGDALYVVQRLINIKSELKRIARVRDVWTEAHNRLEKQSSMLDEQIVRGVQNQIDHLENTINNFYHNIQGDDTAAPRIKIRLIKQGNQRSAQILMDFKANSQNVMPGGYLSDSQLSTLAFSIQLAAIRMFNTSFKILVLDDVVTSYDADHRKSIAGVLATNFQDFQIILTTHDDSFFDILKDHLPRERCEFKRIRKLENTGPIFEDDKTNDTKIEEMFDRRENPRTLVRIEEEKWLHQICQDFKTRIEFRPNYRYTNAELAMSLGRFLKDKQLIPPSVPGMSNSFLTSLQTSTIENLASHFNISRYKSLSIGDMRQRWEEFKYFRGHFVCSKNKDHTRFIRPDKYPICKTCNTRFGYEE